MLGLPFDCFYCIIWVAGIITMPIAYSREDIMLHHLMINKKGNMYENCSWTRKLDFFWDATTVIADLKGEGGPRHCSAYVKSKGPIKIHKSPYRLLGAKFLGNLHCNLCYLASFWRRCAIFRRKCDTFWKIHWMLSGVRLRSHFFTHLVMYGVKVIIL